METENSKAATAPTVGVEETEKSETNKIEEPTPVSNEGGSEPNKPEETENDVADEDEEDFDIDVIDDDVDDDDDGKWGDVMPPPAPGEEGSDSNGGEAKDDREEVDVEVDVENPAPKEEEKAAAPDSTANNLGNRASLVLSRIDVALKMGFTEEELPLWGYLAASLVFFFAAISMRPRKEASDLMGNFRHRLQASGDYESDAIWADELGNDNDNDNDDGFNEFYSDVLSDILLAGSLGRYMALPRPDYIYAVLVGFFGVLMSGGLIGWMRYNASAKNGGGDGGDVEAAKESGEHDGSSDENPKARPRSEVVLEKVRWLLDGMLVVWAIVAWGFFTVVGGGVGGRYVFGHIGNGYFALWAMLIFSLGNCGLSIAFFKREAKNADSCVYGLTIASIVVIIELSVGVPSGFWRYHAFNKISTYTLVVAVFSLFYGLLTAGYSRLNSGNYRLDPKIRLGFLLGFFLLWIIAACLSTFIGPFLFAGNGYFAAWACVFLTGLALVDTQREVSLLYI